MRCDHCGNDVPEGVFCTRCGAHLGTTDDFGDAKTRHHRYAAHPGEHVAHPGIFTTLFPHLGHHKVHEFRWAFIAGLAGIFLLYLVNQITAAVLVGAFLVPLLYLLYLYEAQVYKEEPARVLGFTFGGGILVGIVVTVVANAVIKPLTAGGGLIGVVDVGTLLLLAVALPVVQEVLKPLPAMILRGREGFTETVDGLSFGVAAGVGFALAETLIQFSAVFTQAGFAGNPGSWIFHLITLAVLNPLMQGSCSGAVVAAIWAYSRRGTVHGLHVGGILVAVGGHITFVLGTYLLLNAGYGQFVAVVWQSVIVSSLLIYIRYQLHHALLEEAAHMGFSETVCPNCHKHIVASGFCPACGLALTAAGHRTKKGRAAVKRADAATTEEVA
jgi:RsiW-degrading membrane proteinase PrsW (M82 family)